MRSTSTVRLCEGASQGDIAWQSPPRAAAGEGGAGLTQRKVRFAHRRGQGRGQKAAGSHGYGRRHAVIAQLSHCTGARE
eukprot:6009022-Prymnesium_polylepis.1